MKSHVNLVYIESYTRRVDAEMAKGLLESNGIKCSLRLNEIGGVLVGAFGVNNGPTDIYVASDDLIRAREIISERPDYSTRKVITPGKNIEEAITESMEEDRRTTDKIISRTLKLQENDKKVSLIVFGFVLSLTILIAYLIFTYQ